jgi:hypothetical protein
VLHLLPRPARRRSAIEDRLTCGCRDCRALGSFLADPVATTWIPKAVAAQRAHVEEWITRAGCDVDFRTERRPVPPLAAEDTAWVGELLATCSLRPSG